MLTALHQSVTNSFPQRIPYQPQAEHNVAAVQALGQSASRMGTRLLVYLSKGKLKAQDKNRYGGRCRPCTMSRVPEANALSSPSNSSQTISHSHHHPLASIRVFCHRMGCFFPRFSLHLHKPLFVGSRTHPHPKGCGTRHSAARCPSCGACSCSAEFCPERWAGSILLWRALEDPRCSDSPILGIHRVP